MPREKRVLDDFCPRCGLKISKRSAPGSITGYMFDPIRCKCETGDTVRPPGQTFIPLDPDERTFAPLDGDALQSEAGEGGLRLDEGAVVGGVYSIVEPIGQGGMGVVYLAKHQTLQKHCAVKLLPPDQVTSSSWKRFQLEAKSIARLEHVNIVKVTDLGLHKGYLPFYAMEYVPGQSLADKLEAHGRMDLPDALGIFLQVCDGVDYAHRAGIIHRDLKPANIMIDRLGHVKILDFGLAKLAHQDRHEQSLTTVGDIFGSPYYMSPEQCAGEKVDNRSDVYSIGCTLFECLTGRPPFDGNLSAQVMFSQQEAPPPSLESVLGKGKMPEAMEIVMAKLLRKNPVERYQTCRELSLDLHKVKRGEGVEPVYVNRQVRASTKATTSASTASATSAKPEQSSPRLALFSAIACGALLSLGLVFWLLFGGGHKAPAASISGDRMASLPKEVRVSIEDHFGPTAIEAEMDNLPEEARARGEGVAAASAKDTSFYSTPDSLNGRTRTFVFPTDELIGRIGNDMRKTYRAVGKVTIPSDAIFFEPGLATIENPRYISRFRPGEISRLTFRGLEHINPCCQTLTHLPGWQKLQSISFKGFVDGFTPESLRILSALKNLRLFEISESRVRSQNLVDLPFWSTIEDVGLYDLDEYTGLFKRFKQSPKLVHLELKKIELTDEEAEALSQIPNLKGINLEYAKVSAANLVKLSQSKNLASLDLNYKCFADPAVTRSLKLFPKLQYLDVVDVPESEMGRMRMLGFRLPHVALSLRPQKDEF